MSILKEDYCKVQALLESLGGTLCDLVCALIAQCKDQSMFPRAEVRSFINSYELLYFFEKEKNLAPRFSRAT